MSTSDLKSRVRVTRKTGDDNIFKLVEGENRSKIPWYHIPVMKRLQRGIAPLITVFCRRFVTSWEIACDCAATVTHTDKGGWLSCTQRHQVSSVIQMPGLSWKEWQELGKLFVPPTPLTWEGKFHLYTCKCALHSFTVYVSFPLLSLGVKKKEVLDSFNARL